MLKKPIECVGCPLEKLGQGFSTPTGSGKHGILLVGEALGAEEVSEGTPFVGAAGRTLNRIITQAVEPLTGEGLKRDDFRVFNTVACRPPDNILVGAPYEEGAIAHCRPNLDEVIRNFRPKCIVPLGNTAFRWFTSNSGIDSLRGYVYDTKWGPVVPTYHPSYIQRGYWHLARVVQLDILKALQIAREGKDVFKKEKSYVLHPSPGEAVSFLEAYRKEEGRSPLAFDIETPYGGLSKDELMGGGVSTEDDPSYTIERISFSFRPFEAITVPWSPPYIDFAKSILSLGGMKLVWNEAFDVPRLQANGVSFGGPICDAMHAWHFLEPSLPMGLKYVSTFLCPDMPAWKLMSREEPEWYSAADSDTLLRCFLSIKRSLEKQGRWVQFERHFLSLKLILNKMTERGICVDLERRKNEHTKLADKFKAVLADLQLKVPAHILPFSPKGGFKKDRAGLEKIGTWEEGRMVMREFEISPEEELKLSERQLQREKKASLKEEKRLLREQRKEERRVKKEEKERKKNDKRLSNLRRVRRADKGIGEDE